MRSNPKLYREKWDTNKTYLREKTITKAVSRQAEVLQDKPAPAAAVESAVDLSGIDVALLQNPTQENVALIFSRKHSGKLLYIHSRGKWLEWDGTRWNLENTQKAFDFAREISRRVNTDGKSSVASASFYGGVEKICQADRTFAVVGDEFDRDNYLLNTPAGTLDLHTGRYYTVTTQGMNQKKQPFILDYNLSPVLKSHLPKDSRTTVECGLAPHAPDDLVVELCQREQAILVTAEIEFLDHFRAHQRSHNECCWGLMMLPADTQKQVDVLQRVKSGKLRLKHPKERQFLFEDVRHDNLYVNLRANTPEVQEICECEWADDD
jgi:hypothetical protein